MKTVSKMLGLEQTSKNEIETQQIASETQPTTNAAKKAKQHVRPSVKSEPSVTATTTTTGPAVGDDEGLLWLSDCD